MVVGNAVAAGDRKDLVRKNLVRTKFVRMRLVRWKLHELGSGFEREVELDHLMRKRLEPNEKIHCETENIFQKQKSQNEIFECQ